MSMHVISWEEYVGNREWGVGSGESPLALTIGVFDGVHRGHQSLILRICDSPYVPTVITFRQNPQQILKPDAPTAEITNLGQKLRILEDLGVQLTVLIDFSIEFSKISGRVFIDLLLSRPVQLIALGRNFRCGHRLDTGAEEIRSLAGGRSGVCDSEDHSPLEVWIAPPVMDEGQPVSSSRIRQALAAGRQAEAERLLGRPLGSQPIDKLS